jgi:hypothetical protein
LLKASAIQCMGSVQVPRCKRLPEHLSWSTYSEGLSGSGSDLAFSR